MAALELLKLDRTCIVEAHFMRKWVGAGTKDDQWAPRAAKEGMFVLTCDRAKAQDGAPLSLLLPYHGVSAAYLTPTLHGRKQFEKMRSIVVLWPKIVRAAGGERGLRYSIGIRSIPNDDEGFQWKVWALSDKQKARQTQIDARFPEKLWEG